MSVPEGQNVRRRRRVLPVPCALPGAIGLVLFAVLVTGASGFRDVTPGYDFQFPRDHGAHPDTATEWWYYTGHLWTKAGRRYGFELTFFRVGVGAVGGPVRSAWELRDVMPAHFAVTDVDSQEFRYYEKLSRASPFTAAAEVSRLSVFNEGWSVTTNADGSWRLVATEGSDAIDLTLRTRKPPAIHGENGVSVKARRPGYASHYYSMTRLEADGTINGQPATGEAWMDHEFGSAVPREDQPAWDWFSIQLDNETEIMLYVFRLPGGRAEVTSAGSVVGSDGRVIRLRHDQFRITPLSRWRSPRSGATYPMRWHIEILPLKVSLTIQPLMNAQELLTGRSTGITYWEGAAVASGTFGGTPVRGNAYVEMTGYAGNTER